jgi:formylglycine-generating enzyme required for sulfatase activity
MSFTTGDVETEVRQWVIKKRPGVVLGYLEYLGSGAVLELVEVPAGEFEMGSYQKEAQPIHKVHLRGFLMSRYEVTQVQWRAVAMMPKVKIPLDTDPSHFQGNSLPVENVSWEEAVEFCERLSKRTGGKYRLPTEAEWEYAARAGTTRARYGLDQEFAFGSTILPEIVNYNGNYPDSFAPVGLYRRETVPVGSLGVANAWGLFDMHGNVREWCEDIYLRGYERAPTDGSAPRVSEDVSSAIQHVNRGGDWSSGAFYCRFTTRFQDTPQKQSSTLGFRVVRQ